MPWENLRADIEDEMSDWRADAEHDGLMTDHAWHKLSLVRLSAPGKPARATGETPRAMNARHQREYMARLYAAGLRPMTQKAGRKPRYRPSTEAQAIIDNPLVSPTALAFALGISRALAYRLTEHRRNGKRFTATC